MSEQKKPKFKIGDKVVLISKYPDGSDEVFFTKGGLEIGKEYEVSDVFIFTDGAPQWCPSLISIDLRDMGVSVAQEMLVLASEYNRLKASLCNTKINVQAYAEQYGITLEQANNEIQGWLFKQGFAWQEGHEFEVRWISCADYLFTTENAIKWFLDEPYENQKSLFKNHPNKEVFLERNIVLAIKQESDTISFDGKRYIKKEFLKAIQNLNVVE